MIEQINRVNSEWDLIGFFDDGLEANSSVDGLKVLGKMDELNSFKEPLSLCVAIAEPESRSEVVNKILNQMISFPKLVHPFSLTGSVNNSFGRGCIVTAGAILTTGIQLGDFCIVNLTATIGHDVSLGSFCTVMPGCSISGNVSVGANTVVGTGSRIVQGITIGCNCFVGAGAVVTKSFGDSKKIMGVPARSI